MSKSQTVKHFIDYKKFGLKYKKALIKKIWLKIQESTN